VLDVREQIFQNGVKLSAENGPKLSGADEWSIGHHRLQGGLSDGVDVIELNNGALSVSILPTRGMGLWKGSFRGIPLGWQSPVELPVNPAFVDLNDRGGLGWLAGFNEWLCRCGLAFNGPPGEDVLRNAAREEVSKSPVTLHGRIANLPAHRVEIEADSTGNGRLAVMGIVDETSMFGPCLRLSTRIETEAGSNHLRVVDTITNRGGQPAELELLYHINLGQPFLEAGAQIVAPALEVVPRDQRAIQGVGHWNTYSEPETGYAEQVYFLNLAAAANRETEVLLRNATGDRGFGLGFSLDQLPQFTVWKNTAAVTDGYVTGLEPATNLPNFKSFEREQGRVNSLSPNQSHEARLEIAIYDSGDLVKHAEDRFEKLRNGESVKVHNTTQPGVSAGC
jgi:hypothetical protein